MLGSAENEEAKPSWYGEDLHHTGEGYTDEVVDQLLADAVLLQSGGDVRLRLFRDPSSAESLYGAPLTSQQMAVQRRLKEGSHSGPHPAVSAVYLPHALLSSSSALHALLMRAPPDALQLRNVRLTRLTQEGTRGPEVTFDSQQQLTDFFAELGRESRAIADSHSGPPIRVHIQGELCGASALVGRLSCHLTDLHLSFETTVHPCEFELSSYILHLSRDIRNYAGSEEQLTECRTMTGAASSARPKANMQEFHRTLAERQLQIEHPEDWFSRQYEPQWQNGVAKRYQQLSTEGKAALQRQFDETQRICDETDEALKQRWMERARATSPGVSPVWLHVDDSSVHVSAKYSVPGRSDVSLLLVGGVVSQERQTQIELSLDGKQAMDAKWLAWSMKELKARSINMRERMDYEPTAPLNPHLSLPSLLSDTIHVSQLKISWDMGHRPLCTLHLTYAFDQTEMELTPGVALLHTTQHLRSTVRDLGPLTQCESRMELELRAAWKSIDDSSPPPALSLSASSDLSIPFSFHLGQPAGLMTWKVRVAPSAAPEVFDVLHRAQRLAGVDTPYVHTTFPSVRSLVRRFLSKTARFVGSTKYLTLETEVRLEASATRATFLRQPLIDRGLIGWMEVGRMPGDESVFITPKPKPTVLRVEWSASRDEEKELLEEDVASQHTSDVNTNAEPPNKKARSEDDGASQLGLTSPKTAPVTASLGDVLVNSALTDLLPLCPTPLLDVVSFAHICVALGDLTSTTPTVHLRAGGQETLYDGSLLVVLRRPEHTLLVLKEPLLNGDKAHWPGVFGAALPPLGKLALSFVILLAPSPLVSNNALNTKLQGDWYSGPYAADVFPIGKGKGQSKGGSKDFVIPVGVHFLLRDDRRERRSDWHQWMTVEEAMRPPAALLPPPSITPQELERSRASLPVALLSDSRSSTALVHHLCWWLDINELLFGLRRLNRLFHDSPVLTDGAWWKRRLQSEFDPTVTRWNDEVLHHWRTKLRWPTTFGAAPSTPPSNALPVWFDVAVHLQVRLNRFATGILKQTIPQLKGIKADQEMDVEGQDEKKPRAYQPPGGVISIPTALRSLLLISPPFHPSDVDTLVKPQLSENSFGVLADRNDLRSAAEAHSESEFNSQHPHLLWFAYNDQEEGTWFAALYTGVSAYVRILDEATAEDEEQGTAAAAGSGPAGADDTAEAPVGGGEADEEFIDRPCTDLNECPVVLWEVYQQSLGVVADNVQKFLSSRRAFEAMAKKTRRHEAEAAKIASTSHSPPSAVVQSVGSKKGKKSEEKAVEIPRPSAPRYELDKEYMNGTILRQLHQQIAKNEGEGDDGEGDEGEGDEGEGDEYDEEDMEE